MIHATKETLHFHFNRVDLAIVRGWTERDTVLVADELRNFRVGAIEFLLILGVIDAPARHNRELMQLSVGLSKDLFQPGFVLTFLRRNLPALQRFAKVARE
jgi:hypothetical protein